MIQNTLANTRLILKAEIGASLDTTLSTVNDNIFNYYIYNAQNWLASEYDWPYLRNQSDVTIGGSIQFANLPTDINFERATSLRVEVFYNQIYQPVNFGIDSREYNISNAAIGQFQVPVERWAFSSDTQFEVWPVGQQQQVIRFTGQRPVVSLFSSGTTFGDNLTLDLDDLLVVYFAAAKYFDDNEKPNSAAKMEAKATKRMNDLRASYPQREEPNGIILRGNALYDQKRIRAVPIVTVAPRS